MDDMASGEAESLRQFGIACRTTSKQPAGVRQFWSSRAKNGAAYAAAGKKRFIGGIHDGIESQRRDVGMNRPKDSHYGPFMSRRIVSLDHAVNASGTSLDILAFVFLTLITGVFLQ
jgi:hypothetical protein